MTAVNNDVPPTRVSTATHRAPLAARLSIERKLPLIIGTLLLVVIAALSAAAYVEVRRTSIRVASERLSSVALQFRDLFQQSAGQIRARAMAVAKQPAVVEFARTRNARVRERARAELRQIISQPEQVLATELRDGAGAVILSTAPPALRLDTVSASDVLGANARGDSATIGRFHWLGDTIVYPVGMRVEGTETHLVRWRRLVGSRRTREQLAGLVGSHATIFLGNADGTRWTDLERAVPAPPLDLSATGTIQMYDRGTDGERYLAAAAPVAGTPWLVAVDFPYRIILAPVDRFVRRITIIAGVALLLGLFGAWMVSRRITAPLLQLTDAADAITTGDYARRAEITGSDELGRLGHSFNTMAAEVQHARDNLERQVEERTRDLNETLHELHETQDALVRRERLAMLGQLSSGVGHELRNPLGVMTNAVYYLKTVLADAPKTVHEYLEILQQQITLSEKIVGDLLDFARSKPPQRKPTPVREATEAQLSRLGAPHDVRIATHLPDDLPPVLVDPVQLGQIILNLVTNAAQAVDGDGQITIRAHRNENGVQYEVTDNGPGVPPENLEKIFEPLFTTKARGIGLGLAVSRTLARANGGDLTVSSTPGRGATFRLTLPIAGEEGRGKGEGGRGV